MAPFPHWRTWTSAPTNFETGRFNYHELSWMSFSVILEFVSSIDEYTCDKCIRIKISIINDEFIEEEINEKTEKEEIK